MSHIAFFLQILEMIPVYGEIQGELYKG